MSLINANANEVREDDDGSESEGTSEDDSPDFVILDDDDDDDNVVEPCSPYRFTLTPPNVYANDDEVLGNLEHDVEHWAVEDFIAYLECHPIPAFVVKGMYVFIVKHIIGCCSIVNFLLFLLHPVSRTAAPNLQGRPSPSNVYAHDDEVLGELEHWSLEDVIAYLESHPISTFLVNRMYPL